jgi:hypothetical protein
LFDTGTSDGEVPFDRCLFGTPVQLMGFLRLSFEIFDGFDEEDGDEDTTFDVLAHDPSLTIKLVEVSQPCLLPTTIPT